jgi:UDP-galactose transporter B1
LHTTISLFLLYVGVGVAGVFGVFSLFALLQEDVYKKEYDGEFFTYTLFMMACERSINSIVAGLFVLIFGSSGCKVPVTEIFISGVTQMISMSSSNEALRYVSYPTQVRHHRQAVFAVFQTQ